MWSRADQNFTVYQAARRVLIRLGGIGTGYEDRPATNRSRNVADERRVGPVSGGERVDGSLPRQARATKRRRFTSVAARWRHAPEQSQLGRGSS
jgi:hypothetical protein